MEPTPQQGEILLELSRKLDVLTEQVEALNRRNQVLEDLKTDMSPIINDVYHILVEELGQVDEAFTLDDVFDLGKKLIRSTRTLSKALDQLNSLDGLLQDVGPLSKEIFASVMETLHTLEEEGHLETLRDLIKTLSPNNFSAKTNHLVVDIIAEARGGLSNNVTADDVARMRESFPVLMQLIRVGTRPEVLELLSSSAQSLTEPAPPAPGLFGMMKLMSDPEIREGMGVALHLLRGLGRAQTKKQLT